MPSESVPVAPVDQGPVSVNKIGGADMSELDRVGHLVDVLEKRGEDVTLVVSAFQKVTNALMAAMDQLNGRNWTEADIDSAFQEVRRLHDAVFNTPEFFTQTEEGDSPLKSARLAYQQEYQALRRALMEHKKISTILMPQKGSYQIRDQVIGFGERIAGKILGIYLEKEGHQTHAFSEVICDKADLNGGDILSNHKLHAAIRDGIKRALEGFERERAKVAGETRGNVTKIFTGYVRTVCDETGNTKGIAMDVGRSYTDTTAVNVALVMREKVGGVIANFWKKVRGVLTANPESLKEDEGKERKIPEDNQPLLHTTVDIREGLEAAAAGSQLMQPDALALAEKFGLDVHVRNFKRPELDEGTDFVNIRYH